MNESLVLKGLDGANPLGFLAAAGLLRVMHLGNLPCVRIGWQHTVKGWRPSLYDQQLVPLANDSIVSAISIWLEKPKQFSAIAKHPNRKNGKGSGIGIFNQAYSELANLSTRKFCDDKNRDTLDTLAAIGSDAIVTFEKGTKDGPIESSAFRVTRSHEFLSFATNIEQDTTVLHIEKAIFSDWIYDDPIETHSMRWDPLDDSRSRYALRWDNPGDGNPERKKSGAMWGANRLALEALTLFPTVPCNTCKLETTGFTQNNRNDMLWTWPIWSTPINLDVMRSLISLPELQQERPNRSKLQAMGVEDVYRCQRTTRDKYRNFSPAVPA